MDDRKNLPDHETLIRRVCATAQNQLAEFTEEKLLYLPTLGCPHAVALRFAHRDQLATGLAPVGLRPCWAHNEKDPQATRG